MNENINITIVYDNEYPWDVRIEKIAQSMFNNGYSVTIVCRNKNRSPLTEKLSYANVIRLPTVKSSALNSLINITIPFNPFWLHRIYTAVKNSKSEIIIVRDLPLSTAALIVGKITQRPVFIDFAEPYPLTILQRKLFEKFKFYHIITRSYRVSQLLEKVAIKKAKKIFVVCKEARNRLIKIGCKPGKVNIVRNTPPLHSYINANTYFTKPFQFNPKYFIFLYVGILIGGRGIDIVLLSLSIIKQQYKNNLIKFVVVGDGKEKQKLIDYAAKLNVSDMVEFVGWIDHSYINNYIKFCDIGILPFSNTKHINNTIANKYFDFMALKKPVICSNVRPMKKIIKETKNGYLFDADDPISLSKKMVTISKIRKIELIKLGENGYNAFKKIYNWENDERVIMYALKEVF